MKFMITEEDLKGLLKTIRYNIGALKEGDIDQVIFSLEVLESHLENNLIKEDRKVA